MTVELMAYATAISLLIGLAALVAERAVALAAWPRRWIWATAMAISLAGPAVVVLTAHGRPAAAVRAPTSPRTPPRTPDTQVPPLVMAARPLQMRLALDMRIPVRLETCAKWVWLGLSLSQLGLYLLGAARLRYLRRSWPTQAIGGHQVLVTADVGPAVLGLLRPTIVLPRWLLAEPGAVCDTVLAHESEHIAARDPGLVLAGLLLLALAPWNLPLWWQLRRLRLSVEIDCDRRILDTGTDRRHYANTLLRLNQRSSRLPIGSIAIAGRASQIERRVRAMVARRPKNMRLRSATWTAAAIALLVVAAELSPPASAASAPAAVRLDVVVADFDVNAAATSVSVGRRSGALVTYVRAGGPADLAGLARGDVILRYGDTAISGMGALVSAVARTPAGAQHVALLIRRGSRELTLFVDFPAAQSLQPPHPSGQTIVNSSDLDILRDSNLPIREPEVRKELLQISGLNEMQNEMQSALKRLSTQNPPRTNTVTVVARAPSTTNPGAESNVHRLQGLIARYGWPTISMVGVDGAHAAALIAIFAADDTFKAAALARMEPLVRRDEIIAADYAMLYDQVHTPQRYGTLQRCVNGQMQPSKPTEDPEHLDERRAALGLPKPARFCVVK